MSFRALSRSLRGPSTGQLQQGVGGVRLLPSCELLGQWWGDSMHPLNSSPLSPPLWEPGPYVVRLLDFSSNHNIP